MLTTFTQMKLKWDARLKVFFKEKNERLRFNNLQVVQVLQTIFFSLNFVSLKRQKIAEVVSKSVANGFHSKRRTPFLFISFTLFEYLFLILLLHNLFLC